MKDFVSFINFCIQENVNLTRTILEKVKTYVWLRCTYLFNRHKKYHFVSSLFAVVKKQNNGVTDFLTCGSAYYVG